MAAVLADAEIVVVGGGPAGLVTALELRRRDRDVLVVDRAEPPIDKACGEGLMPDGVQRLRELGLELGAVESAALHGIRYVDGDVRAQARFRDGQGRGVRRPVLHQALVERAAAADVRTIWGLPVRGLEDRGVATDRGSLRAAWVVGADGLHSRVRRWLGLGSRRARFRRHGVRRHYAVSPWTDLVEVHWSKGCEAYVTPVSDREVGVALLWSGEKADFDRLLARFPTLGRRLEGAPRTTPDRGAGRLEQRCKAVHRGRVGLVGDAAGYRDAITGEGLSLAFHQARALAEAICAGELASYGRAMRRLTTMPFALIRVLLEAERRPWLRRRLIATLADEPGLFERLLAIHARQLPLGRLGPGSILRLARGLLS